MVRCQVATSAGPRVEQLLTVFTRRCSARVIGREYLREYPDEADLNHLLELSCKSSEARIPPTERDRRVLAPRLERRLREDFRTGRTVRVSGWGLSRTEARLCAMAAMLESAA